MIPATATGGISALSWRSAKAPISASAITTDRLVVSLQGWDTDYLAMGARRMQVGGSQAAAPVRLLSADPGGPENRRCGRRAAAERWRDRAHALPRGHLFENRLARQPDTTAARSTSVTITITRRDVNRVLLSTRSRQAARCALPSVPGKISLRHRSRWYGPPAGSRRNGLDRPRLGHGRTQPRRRKR